MSRTRWHLRFDIVYDNIAETIEIWQRYDFEYVHFSVKCYAKFNSVKKS